MAFVDDDEEEEDLGPQSATNYYFEDDDKEPVSFARLPIQWNDKEKEDGSAAGFYLRGTSGDGLLTLHKLVKAWRFENRNFRPEVSVLTKDNVWIQLEKPRKSFIRLIGSVLITVYSLHYLRRNPQASEKSLWEHLSKFCKVYDVKPSMNDLVDHSDLIAQAVKRDPNLAKCKFLLAFLAKTPTKQRLPEEDDSEDDFIVEDDTIVASDEEESDDEEDEVCAICDNGGNLVCCDGSCLRSFHATKKDGEDSVCDSLNLSKTQVDAEKYYCPNCEHKIHQCFICKKLGSSDNSAETAEVFQCVSARCGYFYHPHCVTRRLRLNKAEAEALERQIIAGEYTCPLHKCCVCGNGEVKTDSSLQFALCRRCPKSYHRKCLPREISFEDIEEEDIFTRAWEGLLRNRVLIYCQEHEIDEELLTPVRDHVKFPFIKEEKVFMTQNRNILESLNGRDNARPKFKDLASRDTCGKESVREFRSSFASSKNAVKKRGLVSSVPDHLRKRKAADLSRLSDLVPEKSQKMMKYGESREAGKNKLEMNERREAGYNKVGVTEARRADKSKDSLGERSNMQQRNIIKPGRMVPVESRHKKTSVASKEPGSEIPTLDSDSQRSLLKIIRKAKEKITMDTVLMKYKGQSTYTNSTKNYVEKTITMGRVEGSVQAIRTALKRLEEGGKTEDAKAVCEPETLIQFMKWKDKLKSYLTPFLHGARYTSYGRHFTNVKKLQQIVDRLHWYVEDGDMIVDFCCGANDFSCLMKKKLEETGKECSYKNYDLFDAKNDFNFERRDWMTVRKEELAKGSRLIMGLNPPFGVNAARANMFISKALEFRPKILILIVPPETERLYNKKPPYVLIWEDEALLSGNSFYLPGSLSVENKQLDDWNKVTPPLSLWSRSDFAAKHKGIAEKQYHVSKDLGSSKFKQIEEEVNASLYPLGASDGICDANSMQRDITFENGANSGLKYEDAPVEKDELDVADCVNNILLSQKIEAWETPSVNHRSDYLSRRSQLENEEKMEDYSGRMLKKPVDFNHVDWKSNDMEEDRVEPNRGLDSTKVIPGMTSDRSSDDIYAVCTPISNTSPQRSHVSVEASVPVITSTKNNFGKDVREPDRKMQRISKPEDTRNRPSSSRSSRENVYAVSRSSANMADMGQKPHETFEPSSGETFSHFDDGLAAKYCFGEGYGMPNPSYIPDQFPVAPAVRNCPSEISDYRGYSGFDRMGTMDYLPRYGSSNLDPMLAPPPPNLMDNSFPSQQQYAPHFDDYQTMDSFPPQPPMQPSRHSYYDPSGYPLPLPPPPPPLGDFGIGSMRFAPGPNYPYNGPSGGWFND